MIIRAAHLLVKLYKTWVSYQHATQVYVQINREAENDEAIQEAAREFFRRLEEGDDQSLSLWKQFREITVEEYKRIYKVTS